MKEIIATGKSLESIRQKYSNEWSCSPEQLIIEVIDKPGVISRSWKVKVLLNNDISDENSSVEGTNRAELPEGITVIKDEYKYTIYTGEPVESVVPFPLAGKVVYEGEEMTKEFSVQKKDVFEFFPVQKQGGLTWSIDALPDGSKAVAKVSNEPSGRYVLPEEIPTSNKVLLEDLVTWQPISGSDQTGSEEDLKMELTQKGIVYGIKPNLWIDFITFKGTGEIIVAEQTSPVPTVQPELIDYVGDPILEKDEDVEKIDFFACKLKTCQKDEVLAEKIPGKEGAPGMDVFGRILAVEKLKDFNFNLKKNVYLSEDGLKVRALCSGSPVRVNTNTYLVEDSYILQGDVDLQTGSVDFPGDVNIGGDIKEGFYVKSSGKVRVRGSVSGATVKAEAGLEVNNNIIASRIILGEKHVFRSQLFNGLQVINDELNLCIAQIEQLQKVSSNLNLGQLFKVLLEKNFRQLPKKSEELDQLLKFKDPEFVTKELEIAVQTIKHFLVGLGPLQLKDLQYLINALKIIGYFLATKGELVPSSVICNTNYVQNSEIRCAGDFICTKGIYNSTINIEGNTSISGVCRGGELSCSGDVYIKELGGSCMSATTLRAAKDSHIKIDYCHPNIKIYVGKEFVRIDEAVQKLEIYREKGILQVEKLKWDIKDQR